MTATALIKKYKKALKALSKLYINYPKLYNNCTCKRKKPVIKPIDLLEEAADYYSGKKSPESAGNFYDIEYFTICSDHKLYKYADPTAKGLWVVYLYKKIRKHDKIRNYENKVSYG